METVARRHGVNPKTLQWWRYELRRAPDASPAMVMPRLLPLVVRGDAGVTASGPVEITLGRAVVRVPVGTDVEYVAALVGAMGRQC